MDIFGIYTKLHELYGPQHWWPVKYNRRNPGFEIAVGAILTQNTSWNNVEKALKCLHQSKLLDIKSIIDCPVTKLQKCLRSSGYYKQKTKKLKYFCYWLKDNYRGKLENLFKLSSSDARKELLSVWGIGPETADSILLYAGDKPVFVIDAYTKRLCEQAKHKCNSYSSCQKYFESRLPTSVKIFKEYHALIVASGKDRHQKICQEKN